MKNQKEWEKIFKDMDNSPVFYNTVETNKFKKYPLIAKCLIKIGYKTK